MEQHRQYILSRTLETKFDGDTGMAYHTAKTGTSLYDDMGVWGRVVLNENGDICEEGTSTPLKNRIYHY